MKTKFNIVVLISCIFSIMVLVYLALYSSWTYQGTIILAQTYIEIPSYIDVHAPKDEFELVEKLTGVSASLLKGHMMTESGGYQYAVGDGGKSLGRFQINEDYRAERERMCGYEYDPFDKFDSTYVAALIIKKNMKVFIDLEYCVAAYRQGIDGVKANGSVGWYANKVIKYIKEFT